MLITGTAVVLSSSGTLPSGMTATTYYLIRESNTTFRLARNYIEAVTNGEAIAVSDDGTGTHTATFTMTSRTLGQNTGVETHQLTEAEMPAHSHRILIDNSTSGGDRSITSSADSGAYQGGIANNLLPITERTGSDTPHNNMQPSVVINWIIKT